MEVIVTMPQIIDGILWQCPKTTSKQDCSHFQSSRQTSLFVPFPAFQGLDLISGMRAF